MSAVVSVAVVCESVVELVPYVYLVGAAALACAETGHGSLLETVLWAGATITGNDRSDPIVRVLHSAIPGRCLGCSR